MDLRDEAFYDFVRQFSGKRVGELLAFQECNGVDSLLAYKVVTAVLQLQSDQLNDLKKNTFVILSNGSAAVLPELQSSINNLMKLFKTKREEINKQMQRIQSIASIQLVSSIVPLVPSSITISISHPSIPTMSPSNRPIPANSSDSMSSSTLPNVFTDYLSYRITTTIRDWLKKQQRQLHLVDTSFQQAIDYHVRLNKRQDGVILQC